MTTQFKAVEAAVNPKKQEYAEMLVKEEEPVFEKAEEQISTGSKEEEKAKKRKASQIWIQKLATGKMFGDILIDSKKITQQQLSDALKVAKEQNLRLGEALQTMNILQETDILHAFGTYLNLEVLGSDKGGSLSKKLLDGKGFDGNFFAKFLNNMPVIERLNVFPLKMDIDQLPGRTTTIHTFHFVFNDPWQYLDIQRLAEDYIRIEQSSFKQQQPYCDLPLLDEDARIEICGYLARKDAISELMRVTQDRYASGNVSVEASGDYQEEMVEKTIREIIETAIDRKATDIHITPVHRGGGLWVRYRIDGILQDHVKKSSYEPGDYNTLLNQCMIKSKIDSTEKRRPQSGSFSFSYNRSRYDIRTETIPTYIGSSEANGLDGSKILFRILYSETDLAVHQLGFSKDDYSLLKKLYSKTEGVLLVTGPTSSGKTTTIYSILKSLDAQTQSVYTVEDPVEYMLEGATQIMVNEKEGRTYAAVLKSLMRLDPDIVFVGEMRDPESARTAMQIANTGHSVFSTLHTNNAYTAISRLISMGLEKYLVIGNINGVVAQRLVRANCPRCLETYKPSEKLLAGLGLEPDKEYKHGTGFVKGELCPECKGSGYKGRLGIYEIAPFAEWEGWEHLVDDERKLKQFFTSREHNDLFGDAKWKLSTGKISPESLKGVLSRSELE